MRQRSDQFRVWRTDRLGGLTMMRATYSQHEYPRHCHDTYVIQVVESGVCECDCGNEHLSMPTGTLLVLHPHEVHDGRSAGRGALRYRSMRLRVSGKLKEILDSGGNAP